MKKLSSLFESKNGVSYIQTFGLLITLFFFWGFALGLLQVLHGLFEGKIETGTPIYTLILITYYAAYLLIPIPASLFSEKFGHKNGVILGLFLYGLGAFLIYPTTQLQSPILFLCSLFTITLGMATLETVATPYAVLAGNNKYAAFRISLGHAFTSLGLLIGPFVGSSILTDMQRINPSIKDLSPLAAPYVGIGILVFLVAFLWIITKLPRITIEKYSKEGEEISMFKQKRFTGAIVALFLYVAAQISIFGFSGQYIYNLFVTMETETVIGHNLMLYILNYVADSNVLHDQIFLSNEELYSAVAWFLYSIVGLSIFMVGRFLGSLLLIKVKPYRLLEISAIASLVLTILLSLNLGVISLLALGLLFMTISLMFPIIFALGIRKMENKTKRASAFIVMAISGGAVYHLLINYFGIEFATTIGLIILSISFPFIFIYGKTLCRMTNENRD